ncbi:MAG TPA: dTDP-4-dehydrorhamnose 3,5-epimerase [Elusimicrobia bacterium]|nr:MAG: dTDP-4-dehydrorhamnose 3,5-epimerase [Elusimicrobia bacterium RIFOXYA12_FULL_49_49]OGS09792.1 MAG: dTDP-4-dehydrorhamnose 3,5-epimerase [Elusimicrobia bacterium RIFOXYA1_FULL_47_7]OGS10810.1 MAG: dTDP-4-dehydrorhamnose 3,5-epimerase [Elusimicrobia bacterium RIFOXYB1_FULL_48_9]OGS16827.1 MAG: dTDP-4-dehydrorhamnose 3,5-epimerase [Elusimicrobia bacterium RIFOXYA2_FULL_47_53]OGS32055.1 MAG: dTDP-4-dehydrorhamnose 3,5-epimerase [Elusimicrobia bacterium RIFOXYB2_FULL_46_23]HBU69948.1 dTDP-4
MIDGVKVKQLKPHCDERGRVMELMRSDWPEFIRFGQVYMTTAYPGVVKGWHYHKKQTDSFICVKGMMKVVLYDSRKGSKTKGEVNEFFIGEHNPMLVQIPKNVYHGFKCISETEAMIINAPTETFNYKEPDEYRLPADTKKIPYNWERKNK